MPRLTEILESLNEYELANMYKSVFGTQEGELVLEDLKNRCFVKTSTAHELPHVTYQNEGMRIVVLHIETQINTKPEQDEMENIDG